MVKTNWWQLHFLYRMCQLGRLASNFECVHLKRPTSTYSWRRMISGIYLVIWQFSGSRFLKINILLEIWCRNLYWNFGSRNFFLYPFAPFKSLLNIANVVQWKLERQDLDPQQTVGTTVWRDELCLQRQTCPLSWAASFLTLRSACPLLPDI